jgi:hypothetical protein
LVSSNDKSTGHGVAHQQNWVIRLFWWWDEKFPHPENKFINGAVPAVTSDYFSACAREHIGELTTHQVPQPELTPYSIDEDVDLIIVELAVNDGRNDYFTITHEWFIRDMLSLPKQPAIVNLQTIALCFETISTGGDQQMGEPFLQTTFRDSNPAFIRY